MSSFENYLDDSDFLSSDDEECGFISSDEESNENQLIYSIINKDFNLFLDLIKRKKCLKEEIYDDLLEKTLNPLHISLKTYNDYNDITYITKLVETKYYKLDDAILYSIFNYDCYNYFKHINKKSRAFEKGPGFFILKVCFDLFAISFLNSRIKINN